MWGQEGVLSLLEKPKIESPDLLSDVQFNVILYSVHPVAKPFAVGLSTARTTCSSQVSVCGEWAQEGPGAPACTLHRHSRWSAVPEKWFNLVPMLYSAYISTWQECNRGLDLGPFPGDFTVEETVHAPARMTHFYILYQAYTTGHLEVTFTQNGCYILHEMGSQPIMAMTWSTTGSAVHIPAQCM